MFSAVWPLEITLLVRLYWFFPSLGESPYMDMQFCTPLNARGKISGVPAVQISPL